MASASSERVAKRRGVGLKYGGRHNNRYRKLEPAGRGTSRGRGNPGGRDRWLRWAAKQINMLFAAMKRVAFAVGLLHTDGKGLDVTEPKLGPTSARWPCSATTSPPCSPPPDPEDQHRMTARKTRGALPSATWGKGAVRHQLTKSSTGPPHCLEQDPVTPWWVLHRGLSSASVNTAG